MNGIRHGLIFSAVERYVNLVTTFATLAIVSRLLTPAEIGVSVVGLAVVTLVMSAREFATTNYIIQHQNLTPQVVRVTFTVLLLVSLATSSLILVSAYGLAAIYSEPKLAPYLRVMAIGIFFEVVASLIAALMRREMAFSKIAFINVTRALLNTGVVITLALLGFSYMSFAWASLVSALAAACLSLHFWPDRSIFKPCFHGWQDMVKFGGYNGVNILLYRIYTSLPHLVLGRILGFDSLALYSRAVKVCELPDSVMFRGLETVLLPAFSSEVRNGRGLRDAYLRSVELMTALQWPALILVAILADPIVRLLLGDQWLGSVPLVRIMAIASLFLVAAELTYPVLVAMGAMRDVLTRSLIAWPISAVIITCAAFFGLKATALAWFVILPLQSFVSVWLVQRHVELQWHDIARALQKSIIVTLCSAAGPLALIYLMGGGFDLTYSAGAIAVILSAIGWGIGLFVTAHPLLQELQRAASVMSSRQSLRNNAESVSDRL